MSEYATDRITNTEDMIDSRDIVGRIEWLATLALSDGTILDDELDHEYKTLQRLNADGPDYAEDWEYGAQMIRGSYFATYAEDFAVEIGAYDPSKYEWPLSCIDWEQAARELQMDYTSVDFDGVDYWVR